MRGLTLTLSNAAEPLALAAATPWRDASQKLVAKSTTWFAVQP
jgi:hypothetical protein